MFPNRHQEHGRQAWWRVWTPAVHHSLLHTCICNGTTKMQHPKIFGWRHMQVLISVVNHWDRQPKSWTVTRKHHPHTVNPVFWWTAHSSNRLPHRVSAFLHLSSHAFPASASPLLLILTDCPSLDKTLASFDALLLESRVVCCGKMENFECHSNVSTVGRERVGEDSQLSPESLKHCL